MNKYIIIVLITVILVSVLLSGCTDSSSADEKSANELKRASILQEFNELSKVPRNNGDDMMAISEYIIKRLKDMGLKAVQDDAGNIMAEMPASKGYENAPTTILQSNMDMISVAETSIIFDSEKDGITPIIDEEDQRITGNNTSLGGTSGVGMANIFFILQNSTEHGPIKAVFTVDGAGNMNGARKINPSFLEGDYLINMTNNKNSSIETGSAYSSVLTATKLVETKNTKNKYAFILVADGFIGGNSGIGAQEDQGNPIKFLAEVLALAKSSGLTFELNQFTGGNNVYDIPETATVTITVNDYEKSKISSIFNEAAKTYLKDHAKSDPDASLDILETTVPDKCLNDESASSLISFLYGLTDGKYSDKSSTTASSSISIIEFNNNEINMGIFVQGKMEASVKKITEEHKSIAQISDIEIKSDDFIIGFTTLETDELPVLMFDIYKNDMGKNAELTYMSTRTELGFFQQKNSQLQLLSIGPTVVNSNKINEYVKLNTIEIPATAVMTALSRMATE